MCQQPKVHIRTFSKRWSFILRCFFPVSILKVIVMFNFVAKGIFLSGKVSQLRIPRGIKYGVFGSLVHQINSVEEVLKLKQNFQKNKVVTGKTPFFVRGPFHTYHSIRLNIDF